MLVGYTSSAVKLELKDGEYIIYSREDWDLRVLQLLLQDDEDWDFNLMDL